MTIFCRICKQKFISTKPGDAAMPEILEKMTAHLATHPTEATSLKELLLTTTQLLATYLLIKNYIQVAVSEKAFLDVFSQNEQSIIEILGLLALNDPSVK